MQKSYTVFLMFILAIPMFLTVSQVSAYPNYRVDVRVDYLYLADDGDFWNKGELVVFYEGTQDDITDREDYLQTSIDSETSQASLYTYYNGKIDLYLRDKDGSSWQTLLRIELTIKQTGTWDFSGKDPLGGYGLKAGDSLSFGSNIYKSLFTECIPNPGYGEICNGFDILVTITYLGGE